MNLLGVCTDLVNVWKLIGNILLIFKIVIPVLIIIFGAIDFGKAVVASKPDEIKNAGKSLMLRALAGILVFFVPTIVGFIFTLVGEWNDSVKEDYKTCGACITSPNSADCK